MKKFFLLCLVAAAAAATFVSCSKKDDDGGSISEGNLVGRWELYKSVEEDDGDTYVDDEYGEKYGYRFIFELYNDNTGVFTSMTRYDGVWDTSETHFTCSVNENSIRVNYDYGYSEVLVIRKLTATELVLVYDDNGYAYIEYYKRL